MVSAGKFLHVPIDRGGQAYDASQPVLSVGDLRKVLSGIGVGRGLEETALDRLDGPVARVVVRRSNISQPQLRELGVARPAEPVLAVTTRIERRVEKGVHHRGAGPRGRE